MVKVRVALVADARTLQAGMNATLHDQLVSRLNQAAVPFRLVTHPPTPTSADAARARGEPLDVEPRHWWLKPMANSVPF